MRHLLGKAEGQFRDSRVVCEKKEGCISDYRTSASAFIASDSIVASIASRAKRFAGLPYSEDLQVVRYFEGQEFKPHLDAFDLTTLGGRTELERFQGRQRDATFLIYLGGPDKGGATRFTELGLDVPPTPGAAVFWRNVLPDGSGRVNPRTRHAGMPVLSGVKYAANLWLRGQKVIGSLPARTVGTLGKRLGSRQDASGPVRLVSLGFVPPSSIQVPLHRIGEFRPSPEADARRFGVKVDRRSYTGTRHTLQEMARMIRDGSSSPAMRQFAEAVVRNAGVAANVRISDLRAAEILLEYVRKNVRYRPDPHQTEYVQSPEITLCVPGASICIPVGDCDDEVVALGALFGAYGIQVKIMKQTFDAAAEQEHVLIIFKDAERGDGLGTGGSGRWLAADPTVDKPIGWRATALKEEIVDPVNPSGAGEVQAEYVGVGGLGAGEPLSSASYLATLQDIVAVQSTRVAVAVETCNSQTPLDVLTNASWDVLARRALTFASGDATSTSVDEGKAVLAALNAFAQSLVKNGCTAGADVPTIDAPIPPPVEPGTDWEGLAKLGLYTLMFGVGAYGLSQVVDLVKIAAPATKHLSPAAAEARRLVARR